MAEQNFPGEQIQRMFPRLDDLLELHTTFLRKLLTLQTINPDRSIDDIGPTLLEQVICMTSLDCINTRLLDQVIS